MSAVSRASLAAALILVAVLGALVGLTSALPSAAAAMRASSTEPAAEPALYSCMNARVVRPSAFVISCAGANAKITNTTWSTWTATSATGTTTFLLNLCEPSCAASGISEFAKAAVMLSAPVPTRSHGVLFSHLVVTYLRNGKHQVFAMDWKGTPAFN